MDIFLQFAVYLFKSKGIMESSVPWKSITDIGLLGMLLKPNNGAPETGAIDASTSLKYEAANNDDRKLIHRK